MDARQSPGGVDSVALEERGPQPVLSIRGPARIDRLTEAQGENLRELWSSMHRWGVTPAGPPFVRYHTFGAAETDLEIGLPVADGAASGGGESRAASCRAAPRSPPGTSAHTTGCGTRTAASRPG